MHHGRPSPEGEGDPQKEQIPANHIPDTGLISSIYKDFLRLNNKLDSKMGKALEEILLQRRCKWPQNQPKDARHHRSSGTCNQGHKERPPHAHQDRRQLSEEWRPHQEQERLALSPGTHPRSPRTIGASPSLLCSFLGQGRRGSTKCSQKPIVMAYFMRQLDWSKGHPDRGTTLLGVSGRMFLRDQHWIQQTV